MTLHISTMNNVSVTPSADDDLLQRILRLEQTELEMFEYYMEHNALNPETEIDPDKEFFSSFNKNCNYYTQEQYNNIKSKDKLSIIHFNSRSMYTNFSAIKEYLQSFTHPFSIIAISETWFNKDKGIQFELDDYELTYMNRENKKGGRVALYSMSINQYNLGF